jgi:hypothetical protein
LLATDLVKRPKKRQNLKKTFCFCVGFFFEYLTLHGVYIIQTNFKKLAIDVPDTRAGHCLEPEGNGVSLGEGGERGPGPPRGEGDKQSVLNRGRDNMDKDEEERASQV